jgi:hypothetical protein
MRHCLDRAVPHLTFALRGARKLVRGLRQELTEERYRVANDIVHRLKQHGDLGGCRKIYRRLAKGTQRRCRSIFNNGPIYACAG